MALKRTRPDQWRDAKGRWMREGAFTAFMPVWEEFAREVNYAAKRELGTKRIGANKGYGVATRTLQRSLSVKHDGKFIEFYAAPPADLYADFINQGVNGTQVDQGSEYSYRDKMPPISAIRSWMKVKPVRLRDPKTGEFIKQTESKLNSAAFNIARSIQRKGITGLRYYEAAFEHIYPRYEQKLANAMAQDIEYHLNYQEDAE